MARPKNTDKREAPDPAALRSVHDTIVSLTDAFSREHVNEEFATLCRRLAGLLIREQPSSVMRGKPEAWACGIARAIAWANFLDDPSLTPHVKSAAIDQAFGVSLATGQAKSKAIRDLFGINRFDPEWTLPSRLEQNPMAWLISVNGLPMDARMAPREIQEEAFRKGLIPYLPGEGPGDLEEVEELDSQEEDPAEENAPEEFGPTATADAACLVGELHLSKGEYQKAVEAFTRAIENHPTADAYEERAKAYRGLAEADERQARELKAQMETV
jgi:tetratricopeptide (TPR) repeat protein